MSVAVEKFTGEHEREPRYRRLPRYEGESSMMRDYYVPLIDMSIDEDPDDPVVEAHKLDDYIDAVIAADESVASEDIDWLKEHLTPEEETVDEVEIKPSIDDSDFDAEFDKLDQLGQFSPAVIRQMIESRRGKTASATAYGAPKAPQTPADKPTPKKPTRKKRRRSYSGPVSDSDTGYNDPNYGFGPSAAISEEARDIIRQMQEQTRLSIIERNTQARLEEQRRRPQVVTKTEAQIREEETLAYDVREKIRKERRERGY